MLETLLEHFNLSDEQIKKLNIVREEVIEYNKMVNLTSILNEEEFNIKHILDSLSINTYYDLNNKKILDVGSGGGFPGLALAIVLKESEITMLDSSNKKINFINYLIKKLDLNNCKTIYGRVEEMQIKEKYDIVVARAVASLNILLEITAFAAKEQGQLIFYKGSNLEEELPKTWDVILNKLGLKFEKIEEFNLTNEMGRAFISFVKTKKTNEEYPRLYSTIKNKPLY